VAFVNAHPGLSSAAGGVGFGLLLMSGSGWSLDPINIVGAVALGAVFAVAMFRGIRRSRR
jgi:hypothetical protein